jgi:hypothetical protein
MNVYLIRPFAKPQGGKFDYYAQLSCKKRDAGFLKDDHFIGRPFPKPWRPVKLYFDEPLWPRGDFYHFGGGNFVCSDRAKELVGFILERFGELLPISIEGEAKPHYLYNVTNCSDDYMDAKNSLKYELVGRTILSTPAFRPQKIKSQYVFKIPRNLARAIYCVEGGTSEKNELKHLVKKHNLTGLKFELAWNDKDGPVRK